MSLVFYDSLIVLDDLEIQIKTIAQTPEERDELWDLVDRVMGCRILDQILSRLPKKNHFEFLQRFHQAPHSLELLDYLKEKIEDVEEMIRQESQALSVELREAYSGLEEKG